MIVKCIYCNKEFKTYPSYIKRGGGKYCNKSCRMSHTNKINNPAKREDVREKISKNHADVSGKNNPMYGRGGKNAPGFIDGRNNFGGGYRGKALVNYDNKCNMCGENDINKLEIHHKDKDRKNNKLTNLIILCEDCHRKIHPIYRDEKGKFKKRSDYV